MTCIREVESLITETVPENNLKIKKREEPKARRSWKRNPVTKVKESEKAYNRSRVKRNERKVVENDKEK